MSNVLVRTNEISRKEWLEWRQKGLGGSDAAVVCGLSRYKSPIELWLEKTGRVEPKEAGEAAYWGTVMEPIIRNEFEQRTGMIVELESSILQHSEYPFMLANLDGMIVDPIQGHCIFEAKTASSYKLAEWESSIPEEYQLQVQHYMAVTGFIGSYVAVLIGGNQFHWQFMPRDEELIEMMIRLEAKFWRFVETDTMPPIDGSDAAAEFLNSMYSKSNAKSQITLPDEAISLIKQYEEASDAEKADAERKDEAGNKLKSILKDNEVGTIGDRIVSWKSVVTDRLDTKKLKAEMADIYEKYSTKSSYRRFTIK